MAEASGPARNRVLRACLAGLTYFALVFAAGFVLGTVRVLVLLPALGETAAVLLELPLILAVSWYACRGIIARLALSDGLPARLTMGGIAFGLLMIAEAALGMLGFGRTLAEHLAHYLSPAGMVGLLGQLVFAAFPILQR